MPSVREAGRWLIPRFPAPAPAPANASASPSRIRPEPASLRRGDPVWSSFNLNNACYLLWDGTHNTISLTFDNPANGQTPFTPERRASPPTSNVRMNAANSTIVTGATQVVITLDLTFNSTFFGPKNIYLYAGEALTNSGWAAVGTWTVTGGASSAISVSPNSGSGTSPTFLFTVSDSSSQTNISGMTMLITSGAPIDTANACYLVYTRTINTATIGLWDNTGNTTLSTKAIGSASNLFNSQCAVGFTAANVVSGTIQLSIQLVFFKPAFAGPQSIYLEANEPSSSSGLCLKAPGPCNDGGRAGDRGPSPRDVENRRTGRPPRLRDSPRPAPSLVAQRPLDQFRRRSRMDGRRPVFRPERLSHHWHSSEIRKLPRFPRTPSPAHFPSVLSLPRALHPGCRLQIRSSVLANHESMGRRWLVLLISEIFARPGSTAFLPYSPSPLYGR